MGMTPNLLERCGKSLYGPQWQTELARALGVSRRTVLRWVSTETPIPDKWGPELQALIGFRRQGLESLYDELSRLNIDHPT